MSQTSLPYAAKARRHLQKVDVRFHPILKVVGPCILQPRADYFTTLVRAIVSQQISTKAANSISAKLLGLMPKGQFTPRALTDLRHEELRSAGLSQAKATYMHDLAEKVLTGVVQLKEIDQRDDEGVIDMLIQVKGIGRWTAEMFLIFSLGRPDVLPVDDLGLRVGVQRLDGLEEPPSKAEVRQRGAVWAPFRSIATWYLWQSLHDEYAPKLWPAKRKQD